MLIYQRVTMKKKKHHPPIGVEELDAIQIFGQAHLGGFNGLGDDPGSWLMVKSPYFLVDE
jgi:hypothetical protein